MAILVSEDSEFSCNFCTSKLKLQVMASSSTGDSQKLANQTNCFLPPPGGNCTFPPGTPPKPCIGVPPGMVVDTAQTTVKIDGQAALSEGCKFNCPVSSLPVTLSKSGQEVAKNNEASSNVPAYVGGSIIIGGIVLAIALLPEEVVATAAVGAAALAKAVARVGVNTIKKIAIKTKNAFKAKPKNNPKAPSKGPKAQKKQIQEYLNNAKSKNKKDLVSDIKSTGLKMEESPDGRFTTFRDKQGRIRAKIHPPDKNKTTPYDHLHIYDKKGNPLDSNLFKTDRKSIDAHIPYGGP